GTRWGLGGTPPLRPNSALPSRLIGDGAVAATIDGKILLGTFRAKAMGRRSRPTTAVQRRGASTLASTESSTSAPPLTHRHAWALRHMVKASAGGGGARNSDTRATAAP